VRHDRFDSLLTRVSSGWQHGRHPTVVKRIAAGLRLPEPYAIPGAETPIPEDALPEQGSGVGTMTPIPERPMAYPVLHVMVTRGAPKRHPCFESQQDVGET
jgi:hypothetical protein